MWNARLCRNVGASSHRVSVKKGKKKHERNLTKSPGRVSSDGNPGKIDSQDISERYRTRNPCSAEAVVWCLIAHVVSDPP